jgi:hypothetical protein
MRVPDPASDNLLYHYTSEAGLRGILESDRIWATDVRFLNDDTEFQRAFNDKYLQIVIEAFRTSMRKDIDSEAARIINGMLSARNHAPILELIEKSKETNDTFVCSFSRPQDGGFDPGDRLSQCGAVIRMAPRVSAWVSTLSHLRSKLRWTARQ